MQTKWFSFNLTILLLKSYYTPMWQQARASRIYLYEKIRLFLLPVNSLVFMSSSSSSWHISECRRMVSGGLEGQHFTKHMTFEITEKVGQHFLFGIGWTQEDIAVVSVMGKKKKSGLIARCSYSTESCQQMTLCLVKLCCGFWNVFVFWASWPP